MDHGPLHLFLVSAVVMGIAQTVAKEEIFAPVRSRLGNKDTWLGYLISCPYCLSHWIAFAIVPLTGAYYVRVVPRWGLLSSALDWFLSSILVVVVAAFLRVGFWLVDESQGLVRRRQKTEEATTQLVHQQAEVAKGGEVPIAPTPTATPTPMRRVTDRRDPLPPPH